MHALFSVGMSNAQGKNSRCGFGHSVCLRSSRLPVHTRAGGQSFLHEFQSSPCLATVSLRSVLAPRKHVEFVVKQQSEAEVELGCRRVETFLNRKSLGEWRSAE
jgi:hypothetical protein